MIKKTFQAVGALLIGTAIALALSEWVLSTFGLVDTPPGLFRRSATRAFEHRPFFKGRDRFGNRISINSMGLRDREYAIPKPSGTVRILVLGDSVAFGDGVRAEDTFVKQLEAILRKRHLSANVEVLNAGVRGYNTFQELQFLKEIGPDYEPDGVVVAYVLNDAEPLAKQSGLIDSKHARLIQFKNFIKEHFYTYAFFRRVLELTRHRVTPKEFLESYDNQFDESHPGWKVSRESLGAIRVWALEHRTGLLLAVFPRLENKKDPKAWASAQRIYRQVTDAGQALGIETLGLFESLEAYDAEMLKLSPHDIFHLNPLGNRIAAQALADVLDEKIA